MQMYPRDSYKEEHYFSMEEEEEFKIREPFPHHHHHHGQSIKEPLPHHHHHHGPSIKHGGAEFKLKELFSHHPHHGSSMKHGGRCDDFPSKHDYNNHQHMHGYYDNNAENFKDGRVQYSETFYEKEFYNDNWEDRKDHASHGVKYQMNPNKFFGSKPYNVEMNGGYGSGVHLEKKHYSPVWNAKGIVD